MNDLVELGLRDPGAPPLNPTTWKPLALQVLRVLCDARRDGESKDTVNLRARLIEHRRTLTSASHEQEERQEAAACVRTCEQYLRRIHLDHVARETELVEMVTLLREATTRMVGDSTDFHAELQSSSERFKLMVRIDDIRELKRDLAKEVTQLERVVEAKKERDRSAIDELSKRVELLQTDLMRAEERAALDPLTKIANRDSFERALPRMMGDARATGNPLALAMIDVDHFKSINDVHGHLVGDRVLLCMAEWLRTSIRQSDLVARYGGEEFAVIMPGADLKQAEERFTQILEKIAGRSYDYEDKGGVISSIRFTASCGVSQLVDADAPKDLIGRADHAVYEAKQKGRNRVVCRKYSRLARLLARV